MFRSKWALTSAAIVMAGTWALAADTATDTTPPKHHAKVHKLIKPYSEIPDLTDDEKAKISDLHAKALEQIKAIEAKEKEDILEVLTDDQKKELKTIEEKAAEDRRMSRSTSKTETTTAAPAATPSSDKPADKTEKK